MNFIKKLFALIYLVLMVCAGVFILTIAINIVPSTTWSELLDQLYASPNCQIALGAVGVVFILIGIIAPYRISKRLGSSKLITFQNPDGEVTVSLSAIETYVRKVAKDIPGIKDIKSSVKVNKKGINVVSYIGISAGTNIPDTTERIQVAVKNKIQDMLGVEENINVTMHINKIDKDTEIAPEAPQEEESSSAGVPFRELE